MICTVGIQVFKLGQYFITLFILKIILQSLNLPYITLSWREDTQKDTFDIAIELPFGRTELRSRKAVVAFLSRTAEGWEQVMQSAAWGVTKGNQRGDAGAKHLCRCFSPPPTQLPSGFPSAPCPRPTTF